MTEISMNAECDLAGVLQAQIPERDAFLTLRDGEGKVLWSGSIHQICSDHLTLRVRTEPVRAALDRSIEAYRITQELKLRQFGIL